jgi:hypothetical protein
MDKCRGYLKDPLNISIWLCVCACLSVSADGRWGKKENTRVLVFLCPYMFSCSYREPT